MHQRRRRERILNMKKTMLTYRTLDRFETLVDISTLTAEQIEWGLSPADVAIVAR